jgi:hypothetical protein
MSVRINEPRHYHSVSGIDDFTVAVDCALNVAAKASGFDAIATHKHRAVFDDRELAQISARAGTMRAGKRDKLRTIDYRD